MKIPKILILVLAGNTKVSNRNLKTQQNTWMMHSYPQIEIISYKGGTKNQFINSELICFFVIISKILPLKTVKFLSSTKIG